MGRDKNGIGNRGLKELTCTTHGCELSGGMVEGLQVQGRREIEGENWENCNSIINKNIFFNFDALIFF